jgi:hypothetical protein
LYPLVKIVALMSTLCCRKDRAETILPFEDIKIRYQNFMNYVTPNQDTDRVLFTMELAQTSVKE